MNILSVSLSVCLSVWESILFVIIQEVYHLEGVILNTKIKSFDLDNWKNVENVQFVFLVVEEVVNEGGCEGTRYSEGAPEGVASKRVSEC